MYTERTDKPASQWTVQDIEARVGFEEGAYLEFKRATEFFRNGQYVRDKLVEELVETASAFLNADGGTILLGVQTDQSPDDKKVEYLKPTVDWEWAETLEERGIKQTATQVQEIINSNLSPRPFGIQVNRVEVSVGDMVTGVMVVTVPASRMGAHQSLRMHRYYRRIADGDMPMADYEIRDVNNRRLGPLLSLRMLGVREIGGAAEPSLGPGVAQYRSSRIQTSQGSFDDFHLIIRVQNSGNGTAHAARFDIGIPVAIELQTDISLESDWLVNSGQASVLGWNTNVVLSPSELSTSYLSGQMRVDSVSEERVQWWTRSYQGAAPECHPIWPHIVEGFEIGRFPLRVPVEHNVVKLYWIPWRCISENMPETRGVVLVTHGDGMDWVCNFGIDTSSWAGKSEDEKFQELKERFGV